MIDLFEKKKDVAGALALKSFWNFFSSIILLIIFHPLGEWLGPTPHRLMVDLAYLIIFAAWIHFTYRVVLYFLALIALQDEKALFKKDKIL